MEEERRQRKGGIEERWRNRRKGGEIGERWCDGTGDEDEMLIMRRVEGGKREVSGSNRETDARVWN